MSETVGETLHVDPAQINALRMYCSSPRFKKGVAMHVRSLELAVMKALQPYAVRLTNSVAANLPDVIALPDDRLR